MKTSAMETTDAIVIVGTGLAGYTVAREVRKLDANVPIVLISESDGCFYSKPTLSNALAMKKQPTELALFDASTMAMQLNACVLTHRSVERIVPDSREIVVGGEPLSYARLVLAIGADARRVPMQGDGASDVLSVNSLADYARFRERLQSAQSVAILGAGLIGCEFANDLALAGYRVSLIDPAAAPLSRLVPEPIGVALAAALERHGVRAHLGTSVTAITRSEQGYQLICSDGERLAADLVVSAIGLAPRTALAADAGLAIENGIRTDAWCRTSAADIYALGDCAAIDGKAQPYVLPIMHAARALARTLTVEPTRVDFPVMPITVKVPAAPTIIVPPAEAGEWLFESADGVSPDRLRAVCEHPLDRRLLGFALLGEATTAKAELIKAMMAAPA
ncbi:MULTISPECIES: NAD(P)/FAD-dependent oxidoreductase [Paraburkholderia]|uniref:NAD(P)/FAD-dependent oxidoreductase n=1 Tax=Paraburkholderia TaxID=1822464 RepID=UPI001CAEEA11|nr:FAD-dependent oxidoreductase [Paraburkholderia caribensis]GJH33311.1 FAD-dependent oxidoreductase [Paraburkholderia hospita]CAG9259330.1 Rubredoxin-NAD(+) reductase [Paraburkholderia caribensis]